MGNAIYIKLRRLSSYNYARRNGEGKRMKMKKIKEKGNTEYLRLF